MACVLLALCGCVGLEPTVRKTAKPAGTSGYVAGIFSTNSGSGFGLGLLDMDSGKDYVMPFGEASHAPTTREGQVVMIEVPPGRYKLAYWVTYTNLTRERTSKKEIPDDHALARPFTLEPGAVVLLGSLAAETDASFSGTFWTIRPDRISEAGAVAVFKESYPGFQSATVRCLLCDSPRDRFQLRMPQIRLHP